MKYQGLRATVMGLGLFGGGCAAARWLARAGAIVTVTDTAPGDRLAGPLRSLGCAVVERYVLGRHREEDFRDADLVVVNPAVRPDSPWLEIAKKAGARLTSEIELFLEHCPSRLIGVSGSNGKSTTAAMIASVLQADKRRTYLGGNIGGSLLDQVDSMGPDDWVVLELSSFQLHRLSPAVSMPPTVVLTNFTPNHLNWHPDLAHYAASKQRLLVQQSAGAAAVFDPASPGLAQWHRLVQGEFASPRSVSDLPPLAVCGRHNLSNAALAATAASCVGCCEKAIESGLRAFRGLPDRLQLVGTVNGRRVINDSSSTTPESTVAAVEALEGPIWLMAGGADKGIESEELTRCIGERVDGVVFYGQVADRLAQQVASCNGRVFCRAVKTLQQAFALCLQRSPSTATLLLSPACSSHDQFVNYRARGAAFVELFESWRDRQLS